MPSTITPSATPRPSSLACDACRRKHLKCDGASPVCGRCIVEAISCTYTASRRGLGRRNRRGSGSVNSASMASSRSTLVATQAFPAHTSGTLPNNNGLGLATTPQSISNDDSTLGAPGHAMPWTLKSLDKERLTNLFYNHFWGAHPFLLPKAFYAAQHYPDYLELMVCFVGHYYTSPISDASELQDAVCLAMSQVDDSSVCRIQALILYAIILHSSHAKQDDASQTAGSYIARAAKIASQLGLNEASFARTYAGNSPVMEESLRRTWWELYTVDVYIALIHRNHSFETRSTKTTPFLPSSQVLYEDGLCDRRSRTLRSFDNRVFSSDTDLSYSSYCYRIEAIRLVSRVTTLSDDADPENVQMTDNALTSWEYNLPTCYEDVISSSGDVDLMLFQARCFISCAKVFLHFPRSELPPTVPSAKDLACARNCTQLSSVSRNHTMKAVAASKELASLASVPWPIDRHSPLFICGLVLGCIIQLAAASIHFHRCGEGCLSQHRDRVVLMLGALNRLGTRWELARNAVRKLKAVAETVFVACEEVTAPSSEVNSLHDSAMASGDGLSETFWFDLFSPENMLSDSFHL